MPKSKQISAYPQQYFDLFTFVETKGQHRLGPLTAREAQAFRFDLYGFRSALREENHPSARAWSGIRITLETNDVNNTFITLTDSNELFANLLSDIPQLTASEPCEDAMVTEPMDDTLGSLGFTSEAQHDESDRIDSSDDTSRLLDGGPSEPTREA